MAHSPPIHVLREATLIVGSTATTEHLAIPSRLRQVQGGSRKEHHATWTRTKVVPGDRVTA